MSQEQLIKLSNIGHYMNAELTVTIHHPRPQVCGMLRVEFTAGDQGSCIELKRDYTIRERLTPAITFQASEWVELMLAEWESKEKVNVYGQLVSLLTCP